MPDPLVIQVMRQHKQALFLKEEAQMAEMALRWLDVERKLEAQIAALTQQIANEGITSQAKVYRLDRYKQLLSQTRVELRTYEDYVEGRIVQGQLDYGALGIRDASEAIQASYGDYGPWFNRLDVRATENMAGMLGNGKPLRGLLSEAYGDAAQGLTEALTRGTALGWNPRKTAKAMQDGMAHGLGRMMTIARTEQMRVYRESSRMQYEESGVVEGFVRLTAHDSRVCLGCLALEGERFTVKESLYDHPNGRCLAPDSLVAGPPIEAFISRRYDGEIITIRFASGQLLSVTPNHPILTGGGWVEAGRLHIGDNVVCTNWQDGAAAAMRPYKNNVPSLIQEIPSALGMFRLGSVPCTAENFHGDGRGSDVYIVWANRLLRDHLQATGAQPIGQYGFGERYANLGRLSALSDLAAMLKGLFAATGSLLRYGNAAMMLLYRNLFSQQMISLSLATNSNASLGEMGAHAPALDRVGFGQDILGFTSDVAGHKFLHRQGQLEAARSLCFGGGDEAIISHGAEQPSGLEGVRQALFRETGSASSDNLRAFASDIRLDRIVKISIRTFRGHVYNLQTNQGWYTAGNSIMQNGRCANMPIVHNCAAVPIASGAPSLVFERGEEWFGRQPSDVQRKMMGAEKWQAWQRGEFAFADLGRQTPNATWGPSVRPATLRELLGGGAARAPQGVVESEIPTFATTAEAEQWGKQRFGGEVELRGYTPEEANTVMRGLSKGVGGHNGLPLNISGTSRPGRSKWGALGEYIPREQKIYINRSYLKDAAAREAKGAETYAKNLADKRARYERMLLDPSTAGQAQRWLEKLDNASPRWSSFVAARTEDLGDPAEALLYHEAGHKVWHDVTQDWAASIRRWSSLLTENGIYRKQMGAVSEYAKTNGSELFAEVHALNVMGRKDLIPLNIQKAYLEFLGGE